MAEETSALGPDSVLLHIGPHKTGTTAIQGVLGQAREVMAAHGVVYPGTKPHHHDEARLLRGRASGWRDDQDALPPQRVWDDLVSTVRATPGRVVISSEFFGLALPEQRAQLVEEFGRDRLHVLIAARNPGSIALSTWQQVLRDGKGKDLDYWLRNAFERPRPAIASSGFWSWADAATQVDQWSRVLPTEQIRVVVIDEGDRALLPATFEQLLGLPRGLLASATPPHSNRGLTAPEAELLRATVALTRPHLSWSQFSLLFRSGFALRLVSQRTPPPDEPRSTLPDWAADQAAAEAETIIERLRESGVPVIGDLDNLRRVPRSGDPTPIDSVPVELAAEAMAGIVLAAQRRIDQLERAASRPRARPAPPTLADVPARELAAHLRARAVARARRLGPKRGSRA